jgi:hypothetical protein
MASLQGWVTPLVIEAYDSPLPWVPRDMEARRQSLMYEIVDVLLLYTAGYLLFFRYSSQL